MTATGWEMFWFGLSCFTLGFSTCQFLHVMLIDRPGWKLNQARLKQQIAIGELEFKATALRYEELRAQLEKEEKTPC